MTNHELAIEAVRVDFGQREAAVIERFLDIYAMPLGVEKNRRMAKLINNVHASFKPWFTEMLAELVNKTAPACKAEAVS